MPHPTPAADPSLLDGWLLRDLFGSAEGGGPTPAAAPTASPRVAAEPAPAPRAGSPERSDGEPFRPEPPRDLASTGVPVSFVRGLLLKFLVHAGEATGADLARQARLPFPILESLLKELRDARLIAYVGDGGVRDFVYQPTEQGRGLAAALTEQTPYFGAAPVPLAAYERSVRAQAPGRRPPSFKKIATALADLACDDETVRRVGQAVVSGRTLLLFGAPGNGKTSVAERVVRSYGDDVWVPRAVLVDGAVVRVFDPIVHREVPAPSGSPPFDERWVRIERPLVVAGGELTLASLDLQYSPHSKTYEAPLQVKANGGVLLIDDLGRQRVPPADLLNRWIVPLERRTDYLELANGQRVIVPVEQLLVFSTNLAPGELADEAFLRRIPYKVQVADPTEAQFRAVYRAAASDLGVAVDPVALDGLIARHFLLPRRPMRFCHPRDLLRLVADRCDLLGEPRRASAEALDAAVRDYFPAA